MKHIAETLVAFGILAGSAGRSLAGDDASPLVNEELARLDRTPKQTTFTLDSGPDKGKEIRSIDRLEGDTLTSCVAPVGAQRPIEFSAKAGTGYTLRIFRRAKEMDESKAGAVEAEQKRFEGSWRFVSMEMEGKDITANLGADDRLILKGDHFTSKTHRGTVEGTYKVDPTVKPKTIDVMLTDGSGQSQTIRGIYELDGKPRPTAFASAPSSGSSVQVLERTKP
jgi:uncharacterized protein (TIGR03067 family)